MPENVVTTRIGVTRQRNSIDTNVTPSIQEVAFIEDFSKTRNAYFNNPAPELAPVLAGNVPQRWQLTDAVNNGFLRGQGQFHRTSPVLLTTGGKIVGEQGFARPHYVAAESMFADTGVYGSVNTMSRNALVTDAYTDFETITTGSLNLTAAAPVGELAVAAIDRPLTRPFGLYVNDSVRFQLEENALEGATTLVVRRMQVDATITSGMTIIAGNRYISQNGIQSPQIESLFLCGNPNPYLNESLGSSAGRKYTCDGIRTNALGVRIKGCIITNFQGHGIFLPKVGYTSDYAGRPFGQQNEYGILESCYIAGNLSGVTIGVNDYAFDSGYMAGNRDHGANFQSGTNTKGNYIHSWGNGISNILATGRIRYHYLECETSPLGNGLDLLAGADNSYIGHLRMYANAGHNCRLFASNCYIGKLWSTVHYTAKYGAWLGASANDTTIGQAYIDVAVNGGYGMVIGGEAAAANTQYGSLTGHCTTYPAVAGAVGLYILTNPTATDINWKLTGTWGTSCYWNNGVTPVACRICLRGTSGQTIRWPDGTTGTIGTPNIPASIAAANQVYIAAF